MDSNQPVDRLNIEITTNADKAVEGIKNLKSYLTKLKNVADKIGGTDTSRATGNINKLTVSLNHLAKACERIANSGIVDILRSISKINFNKLNGLANAKKQSQNLPVVYKGIVGFSSGDHGYFEQPKRGRSGSWDQPPLIGQDILKGYDIPTYDGGNTWGREIIENLEKGGDKLYKSVEPIVKSFGRIAFYRVVRFIIKTISESAKKGLEYAYGYDTEKGNGRLSQSMDNMASKINQMTASLGSALSEIVMLLEPVVVFLADKIMSVSNEIAETTAKLNGNEYWLKATKVQSKYLESVSGLKGATDQLKNSFLGIDEINQLGQKQQALFDYEQVSLETWNEKTFGDKAKDILKTLSYILPFFSPAALVTKLTPVGWTFEFSDLVKENADYLGLGLDGNVSIPTITVDDIDNLIQSNDLVNTQLATYVAGLQKLEEERQAALNGILSNPLSQFMPGVEDAINEKFDEKANELITAIQNLSVQIYMDGEKVTQKTNKISEDGARRTGSYATIY